MPVISAATLARAEGYFRREWKLAVERTNDMADHVAYLLPVVLDDTTDRDAHLPEAFFKVQWTRLPGGEVSPDFAARVRSLLGGSESSAARPAGATGPRTSQRDEGVASPGPARRRAFPFLAWGTGLAVVIALAVFLTRKSTPSPSSMRGRANSNSRSTRPRGCCGRPMAA